MTGWEFKHDILSFLDNANVLSLTESDSVHKSEILIWKGANSRYVLSPTIFDLMDQSVHHIALHPTFSRLKKALT